MGITVTNVNTLSLLNILNRTAASQSNTLTRLSTGSRINAGKDDPAGLIALRSLETESRAVDAAITNNQRTDALLGVADNAVGQIANLLDEIQSLAQASANEDALSSDELAANQAQIDNAISAIDRIISTTEFNGKKLLDGTQAISVTGVDATKISDLKVYNRENSSTNLTVAVTQSASQAQVTLATTSAATSGTSISISGRLGTVVIDVAVGENLSSVEAKVDAAVAQTGVSAITSGANLRLRSSDYGASAFVRVNVLSGDTTNYSSGSDYGRDAIVTVNGQTASSDGLKVNYSANGTSLSFNLTTGYNNGTVSGSETFTVSGGGATFQLGSDASTRQTIGIDGLFTQQLGSANLGYLSSLKGGGANSVTTNPSNAALIAAEASSQIAKVQGRLGGFQKFQVQTALSQQNASKEALTSAIGVIRDVDYASETAELNKQQVLLQSAISLLGVANQQSSQILSLLR